MFVVVWLDRDGRRVTELADSVREVTDLLLLATQAEWTLVEVRNGYFEEAHE